MSMFSAIAADFHNQLLKKWKEKFEECKTFEEFKKVLKEFKEFEFEE